MDQPAVLRRVEKEMEYILTVPVADNIISPVGYTSSENLASVLAGRSGLRRYEGYMGLPFGFTASLIDRNAVEDMAAEAGLDGHTFFEKLLILSVSRAISQAGVDMASPRTLLVVSTTKGNVSLLEDGKGFPDGRVLLSGAAEAVARHFGCVNPPVVVSNACVSGLCACIKADRCIRSGMYDHVVVTGADEQSPFIISGFQSFMAISPDECRPFDRNRRGLNPGEAAATIVFESRTGSRIAPGEWTVAGEAIRNDACHISAPSRTGEGSYRAIVSALGDTVAEELAFVSLHGTATDYNDAMEAEAVWRAGLTDVPVVGFKGYYGHTMGAAGVMETILSMKAVDAGVVPATRGFAELGVRHPLSVSPSVRNTSRSSFMKVLSGFGGCNAAMLFSKKL